MDRLSTHRSIYYTESKRDVLLAAHASPRLCISDLVNAAGGAAEDVTSKA